MTVKQLAAGVFGGGQAPKLDGLPMSMGKAQSQLPNYGRKHTTDINNLDKDRKNGAMDKEDLHRSQTQNNQDMLKSDQLNRNSSSGTFKTGAGQDPNDGSVSILDTFARIISSKQVEGHDLAKLLRSKFRIAMEKDDRLVNRFFQPERSLSDQQILMNSNRGEESSKKANNESKIPGIYQEVKSSLEFMLNKITNKPGQQMINVGGLDTKRQRRYQSSSLLNSSLMSLE